MTSYEVVLDNAKLLANCYEDPPWLDIPGIVVGYGIRTTLVGGANCVAVDDGDDTYMHQVIETTSSIVGWNDNIRFPATPIPGEVQSVSLVTVSKGTDSSAYSGHTGVRFILSNPAGGPLLSWNGVFANGATEWTEILTDLSVSDEGTPYPITKERLEAGEVRYNPGSTLWNDLVSGSINPGTETTDTRWTYIALRVYLVPEV